MWCARSLSLLTGLGLTACASGARSPFDDALSATAAADDDGGDSGTGGITTLSATLDPSASSTDPSGATATEGPSDSSGGDDVGTSGPPPGDTGCVPGTEVCNGVDDDCNDQVDESDPGLGADCDSGQPGICAAGIQVCNGTNGLMCESLAVAETEVCNGLDDDCDGMADDGNPEGGGGCQTGQSGICAAGTLTCTGGSVGCVANETAAAVEVCGNGLDDDCNGAADDGCVLNCFDTDLGTAFPQSFGGSNAASVDTFASSCGGGADYLVRFQATGAGVYTFDTIGSGYDTLLTVYSDCMGTELGCNDDFAGNPNCGSYPCSELSLNLAAGQQVIVAVEGFSGATGAFTLNIAP
jgi:hypothetical protein